MNSPDFVEVFASQDHADMALGKELLAAQDIVDTEVAKFADQHRNNQTAMMEGLVNEYVDTLITVSADNGGFPDTEAMRIALFGQVAFRYEQDCQKGYKDISEEILRECKDDVLQYIADY